jgi:autotransporter strand-loop-strand O-heptosyltransferase
MNNIIADVVIKKHNIFNLDYYTNLNFLESEGDFSQYTDVHRFEYIFDKPLQQGYSDQFGLDFVEIKPEIKRVDKKRPINANYVCLGVHTTTQAKYWNYPDAWNILSKMLRKEGITPVSVDLYESFGIEGNWNYLPDNSVKKVGLQFDDVINHLQHCDFFIGVSSGLSWLAWALGKKVILISGTTNENNEFNSNCHRVINKNVCHGCFNKSNIYNFDSSNWMWCPVNQNTKDWFICTRTITPEVVWKEVSNVLEEITHDNY